MRRKKGAAPGARADKLVMLAVGRKVIGCQRIWRCWHFHFRASMVPMSGGCNWRGCHQTLHPGLSVPMPLAKLDYLLFDGIQPAAKDTCHCHYGQGLFYAHSVCVCLFDSVLRQSSTHLAKREVFWPEWSQWVTSTTRPVIVSAVSVCSLCFPRGHAQGTASVVPKV